MDMYRFFNIVTSHDEDRGDFNSLVMTSGFDGEFGPVSLQIVAELDSRDPLFHCHFVQTSAASPAILHVFRTSEITYFVTRILPLFNPQTHLKDGPLSFSQEPQSSQNP